MNVWQALLLGAVQGLTEFLPISSSGHLSLFQYWLVIEEPTLFFNVFLHAASLIAILIFFRKQIKLMQWKDYWLLMIASIPVGITGLLLADYFEIIAGTPLVIGLMLIVTGVINLASQRKLDQPPKEAQEINQKRALLIGLFQSLAILPGISRSGSTLLGGLSQQLTKEKAFTFTFLLAVPAILGANIFQIIKLFTQQQIIPTGAVMIVGGLATFMVSLLSLSLLKKFIEQSKLKIFGYYSFLLGGGVLLSQLI